MPTTPAYNPADLSPAAAEATHTHPHTHPGTVQVAVGGQLGNLIANPANVMRFRNHTTGTLTITEVHHEVRTAPAGQPINLDLRRNGVSIHTASILIGQTRADVTGLNLTVADDQYLELIVTQVGSTTPGADLTSWVVATA